MAKGKIVAWIENKGFGFIQPEGTDTKEAQLFFHINDARAVPQEELSNRPEVEYEVVAGRGGKSAAQDVRLAGTVAAQMRPQPRTASSANQSRGENFLNPYNFVRYLTPRAVEAQDAPEIQLMGHCPPPPHDRYVGLSGVIHCKAVAETPLFIADAEGVTADQNEPKHKHYRFFKYEGKEAIPATSLRGPIRNVFEAATNSCFSNLQDKLLSYHFNANDAPKLVPARVHYEEKTGAWQLELLTGTTPLRINEMPEVQYAGWVHRYWPIEPSNTLQPDPKKANKFPLTGKLLERTLNFRARREQNRERELHGIEHGVEYFALLQKVEHPFPKIKFWDLVEISKDEKKLRALMTKGANQRVERGWLCLNNQNIESKHSERFFFRAQDNRTGPTEIELPESVRKDYELLIQDYQERHAKEVEERRETRGQGHDHELWLNNGKKEPAFSRFVYRAEEKKLRGGELVYAWLTGSVHAPEVKFIVPVSVPRVMFENSIQKLLPHERLHRCKNPDELCPACRTFGWVRGEREQEGAFAGRVRFSHALATKPIPFENETLLAILSSPKPTTTRFYLIHKSWQSRRRSARDAGYDGAGNVLRGRKFYRHFGAKLDVKEYTRATDAKHNGKDDQNRTLHGILDKGSEFTFSVRFENLAPVELGALLWSLEMDGRGVHRIGLAKPLGFGSMRVKIDDSESSGLQLFNVEAYYAAATWLKPSNGMVSASKRKQHVLAFKRAMLRRFAAQRAQGIYEENDSGWDSAFDELHNIADLRAMLNDPPAGLAIHYPRMDPQPQPEGKNFEWFMANNREAGRKQGLLLELEVPAEEVKNPIGLPVNPTRF